MTPSLSSLEECVYFRVFRLSQPEEHVAAIRPQAICTEERQRGRCWNGFPHRHLRLAVQLSARPADPVSWSLHSYNEHWQDRLHVDYPRQRAGVERHGPATSHRSQGHSQRPQEPGGPTADTRRVAHHHRPGWLRFERELVLGQERTNRYSVPRG